MSRTYKRNKGRLAKQMLAEQEFERGEEDNHKVASKLALIAGPTSEGHVRKMRSVWRRKLEKRLENNKEHQRVIKKTIKEESIGEIYKRAIIRIGRDMAEKELNEDNRTKSFNVIMQKTLI